MRLSEDVSHESEPALANIGLSADLIQPIREANLIAMDGLAPLVNGLR